MSQRASTLSLSHPRTLSTECQWDGLVRKAKNLSAIYSLTQSRCAPTQSPATVES